MRSRLTYFLALLVAALGAALTALSVFVEPLRATLVYPTTLVAAAVATVLFLRVRSPKMIGSISRKFINAMLVSLVIMFAASPSYSRGVYGNFLYRFYCWYVHAALKDTELPSWQMAIRRHPENFVPSLLVMLKKEAARAKKESGYVDTIDFDPFLNTQDPGKYYRVGGENYRAGHALVDVFEENRKEKSLSIDLINVKGSVKIYDIIYKNGTTLRGLLRNKQR